jgi:hypothetical protein
MAARRPLRQAVLSKQCDFNKLMVLIWFIQLALTISVTLT